MASQENERHLGNWRLDIANTQDSLYRFWIILEVWILILAVLVSLPIESPLP
jgi:hypothetical protein